jgi:3-oxoacyl-[acyl-carrier protein] reductase
MRNVIVTGGSRGVGLAIARTLAASGYRVIAVARQKNCQLTAAMTEIEQSYPQALQFVPFDLSEVHNIPKFVSDIRKEYGAIHGIVNNAAAGTPGVLANMHQSRIEQLIQLNIMSPIVLTKQVVRHTRVDGGGRVVNISSIIGFTGYSGLSVYAATKASMIGFTRSLAREVGQLGINVNAVAPGFMETDMTESLAAEQRQQIARRSALRRLPDVDDVASAVEFLLGPASKNITGTVLTVDAGATA